MPQTFTYWVTTVQPDGHESSYEFKSQEEAIGFLVRHIVIYSGNKVSFERRLTS